MAKNFDMDIFEKMMELKDKFAVKRFAEKLDLVKIRHTLAVDLINLRDRVAGKRHNERMQIISRRAPRLSRMPRGIFARR